MAAGVVLIPWYATLFRGAMPGEDRLDGEAIETEQFRRVLFGKKERVERTGGRSRFNTVSPTSVLCFREHPAPYQPSLHGMSNAASAPQTRLWPARALGYLRGRGQIDYAEQPGREQQQGRQQPGMIEHWRVSSR